MRRRRIGLTRRGFMAAGAAFGASAVLGRAGHAKPKAGGALADHRIAGATFGRAQLRWPRHVGKNARRGVHGRGPNVYVVTLITDRGATGWAVECGWIKDHAARRRLVEQIKGKKVTELFTPERGLLPGAPRLIELALYDLAGVIESKPVYELIGGKAPTPTPCYSGMIYFDDLEPEDNPAGIERVLANCQQDYELGYRQFKIKIGRGNKWMPKEAGLRRDIEVVKQIARAYPDVALLVDGNDGFTAKQIVRFIDGVGDVKLHWIEEPFRESEADYRVLRDALNEQKLKTYLADGEDRPDHKLLSRLIDEELLDVYLTDIVGHGFTAWRKLMPELQRRGVLASPHAWGSQLKTYYVAHLAAALGNTLTIEGVTCECDRIDWGDYHLDKQGRLAPSSAPGFGMKLIGS